MTDETPGIGHNEAPDDEAILRERLREKAADIIKRHDDLMAAVTRVPAKCEDDEMAGKLGDLIKQLTACSKGLDALRVGEKEPFLKGGRIVDGFFNRFIEALDGDKSSGSAKNKVGKILSAYLVWKEAENRRKLREQQEAEAREAQRLADEAAELEAAKMPEAADDVMQQAAIMEKQAEKTGELAEAKPAELSRTRGDYGSVASLRTRWAATEIDFDKVDLNLLRPYIARTEVEKACNAYARTHKDAKPLAGVNIREIKEAAVR